MNNSICTLFDNILIDIHKFKSLHFKFHSRYQNISLHLQQFQWIIELINWKDIIKRKVFIEIIFYIQTSQL